jgi:predicted transposase YbfD/YdcC
MAIGFGPVVLQPKQAKEARILRKSVLQHFQDLPDPRRDRTKDHPLMSVITIAILGILSGADGFVGIEAYGKGKQSWLETFLELPHGIPSHDTFGRVFGLLSPEELEKRFLSWISSITETLQINVIHIDGKTTRGSYDREKKLKALHTVSAWSSEHGLVLAQQKVEGKTNEIKAVPLILKLLNLKGAVITLDAMGTQLEIVRQIKAGGGDYVIGLKGNQGKLNQGIRDWFQEAETQGWKGIAFSTDETVNGGHHRIERRQVIAVNVDQLPPLHRQTQWDGLTTIVRVRSTRQLWNKTTQEDRFYISSLLPEAAGHNRLIRSHWSVENSLHWVLDVTFNEDASRVRQGHAAQNLNLIRRLSVNLLKREPSKASLKMKRYKAGLDNDFLMKILAASTNDAPAH